MHIAHFGRPTLALAAVTLSSLIFGLEISSIPVILPTLEQTLGADFVQLQWVMNAYTIAVATVLMAAGAFADRFGRKRVFLISTIAFGLASLICGLAPDTSVLIAGRFLQGVAGGVMLICQVAILSHGFQTGRARAVAFAWWGVIFGIGLGFGPIIGSAIVSVSSWEWVFLIHVILALVVVGLGLTNTPVTNTATGSVSSERAGMASGMDMSARMITLSINIALMGAILFNGVLIRLRSERLAGDEQFLRPTAERIAAGNADAWRALPDGLAHDALVQGFSLITLYGALGCGALAVASALLFRRANPEVRQVE